MGLLFIFQELIFKEKFFFLFKNNEDENNYFMLKL
jgi:hypothetical protein